MAWRKKYPGIAAGMDSSMGTMAPPPLPEPKEMIFKAPKATPELDKETKRRVLMNIARGRKGF